MKLLKIVTSASEEEVAQFYQCVGKNVKRLRKKLGISQLELALLIGHGSAAFLANSENCARGQHFNLEHLFKISKVMEVNMGEFFKPCKSTGASKEA
ncbi:MAG: helix-turn-helix transcriptional regulator [Campylobacterales bacterium]|nr:helix-turn-helix transcriptional regulator [Campylobacterales bacterium]